MRREKRVRNVILDTVRAQKGLSLGIVFAVIGAVVAALIPPLVLARIVDTVTEGRQAAFSLILLYFGMLAATGLTESAREGLLTVFGQKMTHALRSSLMDKFIHLTTDNVTGQEPQSRADVRAAGTAAVPVCVHAARTEKHAGGADGEPEGGRQGVRTCAGNPA